MKRLLGTGVLLAAVSWSHAGTARIGYIYWAEWKTTNFDNPPAVGDIRRTNLDGSHTVTLISGLRLPGAPALDIAHGQMYFGSSDGIMRANLNGTGITTIVTGATGSPRLDLADGQMFWNEGGLGGPGEGSIMRANIDGSGQTAILPGLTDPHRVALDLVNRKIYSAESTGGGDIIRANFDGSGLESVVNNLPSPNGVALDVAGQKVYWGEDDTSDIRRANFDGTGIQTLVRNAGTPISIDLDVAGGKMYWTEFDTGLIRRSNLDGTGQATFIRSGMQSNVISITLDLHMPGDANGDGSVNFSDLLILAQNYGKANETLYDGDFNSDGKVDFSDLLILAQNYGTAAQAAAVPEPAAWLLFPVALVGMRRRR